MKQLNVTPEEFSTLKDARVRMSESDFAKFVHEWYGCQYFEEYSVVVRYDVPQIPWMSARVFRIESTTE